MDSINSFKYVINNIELRSRRDWGNKKALTENLQTLQAYRNKKSGSFNLTGFCLGVAELHTFLIYSQKKVLHEMEKKAIPHMGMCLGAGVALGVFGGLLYGNSMKNTKKAKNLEETLEKRIKEIN